MTSRLRPIFLSARRVHAPIRRHRRRPGVADEQLTHSRSVGHPDDLGRRGCGAARCPAHLDTTLRGRTHVPGTPRQLAHAPPARAHAPSDHRPTAAGGRCHRRADRLERTLYHACRVHRAGQTSSRLAARHVSSLSSLPRPALPPCALISSSTPASSVNGTFVNRKRIEKNTEHLIGEGDAMTFARARTGRWDERQTVALTRGHTTRAFTYSHRKSSASF